MQRSTKFILFLQILFIGQLMAQDFEWAKEISGVSIEEPIASVTDNNGNTIVTGIYTSPTLSIGNHTLTNANDNETFFDIFLIKYDAEGNVLWAKTAGSPEHDSPRDVAIDGQGNVYLTGYFNDMAVFDDITLETNENFVSQAFLIKYSSDGEILWTRQTASMQFADYPTTMDVDSEGNIYVCGNGLFGDINLFGIEHLDEGDYQGYVLKLDTDGEIQWLKEFWYDDNAGSNRDFDINEIVVNSDGTRFSISGNFWGVFDFGNVVDTSRAFFENFTQNYDIFFSTYDEDGDLLWHDSPSAYEFGGENKVRGISMDINNNLYLGGRLGGVMYFENGDSIFVNDPGLNDSELFLLKYNSNGQRQWVAQVAAQNNNAEVEAADIAVSPDGNVFVTGYYEWDPTFGSLEVPLQNNAPFIAKYNTQGQAQWVEVGMTSSGGEGIDLGIDANQNVYSTGYYTFSCSFGNTDLNNGNLRGTYVTKIGESPNAVFESDFQSQWSISPNPTHNNLQLNLIEDHQNIESIEIIDTWGRVVQLFNTTQNHLNVSNLNPGVYTLRIQSGNVFTTKNFIKL